LDYYASDWLFLPHGFPNLISIQNECLCFYQIGIQHHCLSVFHLCLIIFMIFSAFFVSNFFRVSSFYFTKINSAEFHRVMQKSLRDKLIFKIKSFIFIVAIIEPQGSLNIGCLCQPCRDFKPGQNPHSTLVPSVW
jgi:hypothetical protein